MIGIKMSGRDTCRIVSLPLCLDASRRVLQRIMAHLFSIFGIIILSLIRKRIGERKAPFTWKTNEVISKNSSFGVTLHLYILQEL